jgi:hypothetical protein
VQAFTPAQFAHTVETKGLLAQQDGARPVTFGFDYCGFHFAVEAAATGDGGCIVTVESDLGCLPFTAQGRRRREAAIRILQGAAGSMGGRLRLTADQRLRFREDFHLDHALTPIALITHMTKIILNVRPYLELLLSEVGTTGDPARSPGSVSSSPAA